MKLNREYTAVGCLALIMAIRMLGLFMILPVFSVHAGDFAQATPQLIGIALGVYGLTQGLLQLPLGMISDRIGRKQTISLGLLIFCMGSIYAAMADNIYGIIIGRAIQGAGAIGSVVLAAAADITPEKNRSKAMGIVGLAIGCSFALAMIIGPAIDAWKGLSAIFWGTAGLGMVGLCLLWVLTPSLPKVKENVVQNIKFGSILKYKPLWRLDAGIFILHAILTALFIVVPIILTQQFHLNDRSQMFFYLLILFCSFLFMMPLLVQSEKKHQEKLLMLAAIAVLGISQLLLWGFHGNLWVACLLLFSFFVAFSLLEALLPSWVSKLVPRQNKGTAMGIYSTAQFLGIFTGGFLGGWMFAHFSIEGIFALGGCLSLVWLIIALNSQPSNLYPALGKADARNEEDGSEAIPPSTH